MDVILLLILIALVAAVLILQVFWRPTSGHKDDVAKLAAGLEQLQKGQFRQEEVLRAELTLSRQEMDGHARDNRTELLEILQRLSDSIVGHLSDIQTFQSQSLQAMSEFLAEANTQSRDVLERNVKAFQTEMATKLDGLKEETATAATRLRQETGETLRISNDSTLKTLESLSTNQGERLRTFSESLDKLNTSNDAKLEHVRTTVESKLSELRDDNGKRLEQMRLTVDEKLQGTLEKRLGESFKQVSDRLEQVHRGLGEMQTLAIGVGDLKKVLTNVKTRGGWGEVQLGALLDQMLTPSQFEKNVRTKSDSSETVEYGIKLPGRGEDADAVVWLPVDSKFPIEDYQRLVEAQERADLGAMEESIKALRQRVLLSAKDIAGKYLNPPSTTDFAIMFDWVIVKNKERIPTTRFFDGSDLEKQLQGYKAAYLELPPLLTDTRNHLRGSQLKLGRTLSPAEAISNPSCRLMRCIAFFSKNGWRKCSVASTRLSRIWCRMNMPRRFNLSRMRRRARPAGSVLASTSKISYEHTSYL